MAFRLKMKSKAPPELVHFRPQASHGVLGSSPDWQKALGDEPLSVLYPLGTLTKVDLNGSQRTRNRAVDAE